MKSTFARKFIRSSRFWIITTITLLIKYSPIIFLVFMAYGDQFLPEPLNKFSLETRTRVNDILMIGSNRDDSQNINRRKKTDNIIEDNLK